MGILTSYIESRKEKVRLGDDSISPTTSGEESHTLSYNPSTFHAHPSFTEAGDYDLVIKLPDPKFPYHQARKGTVETFKGKLYEIFPELKVSERDIDTLNRKRDIAEFDSI